MSTNSNAISLQIRGPWGLRACRELCKQWNIEHTQILVLRLVLKQKQSYRNGVFGGSWIEPAGQVGARRRALKGLKTICFVNPAAPGFKTTVLLIQRLLEASKPIFWLIQRLLDASRPRFLSIQQFTRFSKYFSPSSAS